MVQARLVLLALLLGCSALAQSQSESLVPCDAHDHAAQADLLANTTHCKARRNECGGDKDCEKSVIADCDRYVDERCHLPESE